MNCCDSNGVCTQGQDCAIRKQKVVNDAYINGKRDPDPYRETLGSFKELITVIMVVACITLLAYVVLVCLVLVLAQLVLMSVKSA